MATVMNTERKTKKQICQIPLYFYNTFISSYIQVLDLYQRVFHPFVHFSIHPSIHPSFHLSVHPSIYPIYCFPDIRYCKFQLCFSVERVSVCMSEKERKKERKKEKKNVRRKERKKEKRKKIMKERKEERK